jgi:hypothetical protein
MLRPPPGRSLAFRAGSGGVRYAAPVDHGASGGISPANLLLLCFVIVALGFFLFTYFDESNNKKN